MTVLTDLSSWNHGAFPVLNIKIVNCFVKNKCEKDTILTFNSPRNSTLRHGISSWGPITKSDIDVGSCTYG